MTLINSTYNNTIAISFSNPTQEAAAETFPLLSCGTLKQVWDGMQEHLKKSKWECQNNSCENRFASYANQPTYHFDQTNADHCAVRMTSQDPKINCALQFDGDKFSFSMADESNTLVTGSSDFKNYLRANWGIDSAPSTIGSFEFVADAAIPETVTFKMKNGESDFSGNCQIGPNLINCKEDTSLINRLMGSQLQATYAKNVNEAGVETHSFDLETNPLVSFLFKPKSLGSFKVTLDKNNGEFEVLGKLQGLDPKADPIFAGNIKCTDNMQVCDAQGKVVSVEIEKGTFHVKSFEKDIDYERSSKTALDLTYAHSQKKFHVESNYLNEISYTSDIFDSNKEFYNEKKESHNKLHCEFNKADNSFAAACEAQYNGLSLNVDVNQANSETQNDLSFKVSNPILGTLIKGDAQILDSKYLEMNGEAPFLGMKGNASCEYNMPTKEASCSINAGDLNLHADGRMAENGKEFLYTVKESTTGKVLVNDSINTEFLDTLKTQPQSPVRLNLNPQLNNFVTM